jgi:FADH2-dependent halogenase
MHDVAIIGGGPAGSTAAALLAAAGRRVVLFEKERFPRFHIGESLLPFNLGLFDRLGVMKKIEGRFVEKLGARLYSSDGSTAHYVEFRKGIVPGHPRSFQVIRSEFDKMLLDNAVEKGATVHEGAAVVEARASHKDGCELLVRHDDGREETVRARFLLDGSGRDAFIAGRRKLRDMTPHLRKAAVFAHYEGVERVGDELPGDILLIILKDGWFWYIPLPDGKTSIGLVMEGTALKQAGLAPQALLEAALERCPAAAQRLRSAKRITPVHTASDYSYGCREVAGDGYLLMGDAAAFIDPVFSTGVWLAMSSGEMAADRLNEVLGTEAAPGDLSPARFREYERRVRHHVANYTRIVTNFYSPGFMDIFLRPATRFGVRESVISLLAGLATPPWWVRARLEVFYGIVRLQRYVGLAPAVPLLRVLEEPEKAA